MSRSVFFWNSGGTVDGNILPERKAQKRCFMFGDFLCSKFRTGGFHMKQITGNKLLVKALKEEGVEYLFGYPGACTIDISDELYKQDEIKIVLPRHEQALVHEADAYARTTGKVGVCSLPAALVQPTWSPVLQRQTTTAFRLSASPDR